MAADVSLTDLQADAARYARDPLHPPGLDEVIEDIGRQRLAAYYLYSALVAGVIGDDGLAPARWPPRLAEPVQRLGLARFAPRTRRGLDVQLTAAEQATLRNPGRQLEFAQLLVDLINQGRLGPLCGDADRVRLAEPGGRAGFDLELIKGGRVAGRCKVQDHWELVAQHLAGLPSADDPLAGGRTPAEKITSQLKETGISHAVSAVTVLALQVYPLGTVAGVGTRLIRSRLRAGREQADALRQLGQALRTLRAQAYGELSGLHAGPDR
jgi:hypothetical protein